MASTSDTFVLPNAGDFRLLDRKCVQALCRMREEQRYTKGLYAWMGFRKASVGSFLVWFGWKGHLWDFVNEYFLVTYTTINNVRAKFHHVDYIIFPPLLAYVAVLLMCAGSAAWWLRRYRWMPLLTFLFYLAPTGFYSRLYYFNICAPFLLLGLLTVWQFATGGLRECMGRRAARAWMVALVFVSLPRNIMPHRGA